MSEDPITSFDQSVELTKELFALIGEVITRWSFIEEELSHTFIMTQTLVAFRPPYGLMFGNVSSQSAAFFAIPQFRTRLHVVDQCLIAKRSDFSFDEDFWDEWSRIKKALVRLSLKRNKLAHWTVLPASVLPDQTIPARLRPPAGSPAAFAYRPIGSQKDQLTEKELKELTLAFVRIKKRLFTFNRELAASEAYATNLAEAYGQLVTMMAEKRPEVAEKMVAAFHSGADQRSRFK